MSLRAKSAYRTIVADPPWDVQRLESPGSVAFGTQPGTLRSVRLEYPTMSTAAIAALPVEALAEDDAHLYVWTINRYVEATYDIARAWGFEPATLLTWCKAPMGLGPGGAYSQTSEHVLFCRTSQRQARRVPRHRRAGQPRAVRRAVRSPGPAGLGHLGKRVPRHRGGSRMTKRTYWRPWPCRLGSHRWRTMTGGFFCERCGRYRDADGTVTRKSMGRSA